MDPATIVGVVGALFGAAAALGAALAVLKANAAKANFEAQKDTVDVLQAEVNAYKGRTETLEAQDARCRADLQEQASVIGELQTELKVLRANLGAAPDIAGLKTYIDARFDEVIGYLRGDQ